MPKQPHDIDAIYSELKAVLDLEDSEGRVVSNARCGVYAFFDYDGEPIYVGQSHEQLRVRIRRHLTNQRTDAVAMNVLDPFEVCEIEMWPFWDLEDEKDKATIKEWLNAGEFTVYIGAIEESTFSAVLNEAPIKETEVIDLPESTRGRIIPDGVYERRKHPDLRIARRASTIAALARVISERNVKLGLRNTLLTQARRLEHLAAQRLRELGGDPPPP